MPEGLKTRATMTRCKAATPPASPARAWLRCGHRPRPRQRDHRLCSRGKTILPTFPLRLRRRATIRLRSTLAKRLIGLSRSQLASTMLASITTATLFSPMIPVAALATGGPLSTQMSSAACAKVAHTYNHRRLRHRHCRFHRPARQLQCHRLPSLPRRFPTRHCRRPRNRRQYHVTTPLSCPTQHSPISSTKPAIATSGRQPTTVATLPTIPAFAPCTGGNLRIPRRSAAFAEAAHLRSHRLRRRLRRPARHRPALHRLCSRAKADHQSRHRSRRRLQRPRPLRRRAHRPLEPSWARTLPPRRDCIASGIATAFLPMATGSLCTRVASMLPRMACSTAKSLATIAPPATQRHPLLHPAGLFRCVSIRRQSPLSRQACRHRSMYYKISERNTSTSPSGKALGTVRPTTTALRPT